MGNFPSKLIYKPYSNSTSAPMTIDPSKMTNFSPNAIHSEHIVFSACRTNHHDAQNVVYSPEMGFF